MRARATVALLLAVFLVACGSSNKSSSPGGGLSGNWQMSLQSSDANAKPRSQSGFLIDNGGTLTGSVMVTNPPCSGVGNVTGTVSGTSVTLVANPVGTQINLSGTVGSNQGSMGGDYTILSTGCTGTVASPQTGTWTANLVAPLNGSITGSFTSHDGSVYNISGQLSQGQNVGSATATLSGTLSLAGCNTPSGCTYPNDCLSSTTVNITGVVGGNSLALNLVNSDGTQAGQISATLTTSWTGDYSVVASANKPCKDGDHGTVTFTL